MLTMPIAEARAQFSEVLKKAEAGERIGITKGKQHRLVAVLGSADEWREMQPERVLGVLDHWNIEIADNWSMTMEEFLGVDSIDDVEALGA